jgi:uncharacterized small protein (DUF1192 family)
VTPPDSSAHPPELQPVAFPTATAQDAVDRCRAMVRLIDEKLAVATSAGASATATWRGLYASDFDIVWGNTVLSAQELVERIARLAGEIEAGIAFVASEDRRRANLRAQR